MRKQQAPRKPAGDTPELQQGQAKSIAKTERLKRIVTQHPTREAVRVDEVETEPISAPPLPKRGR